MKQLVRWGLAGALLATASPAWAGEVKLSFSNGLVTVLATHASPREILAEWARLGLVRVTNLDRLAGTPVTLQLTDVPETRALETILRGTAGYIAALRGESISTISRYDRILLMPGVAPAMPAVSPSPQPQNAGMGRGRPGQQLFGTPGDSGAGSAGATPGFAPAGGMGITRPGPDRPITQESGQQSFVVAEPVSNDTTQQEAVPLPTSSQVPGVPVGWAGQTTGSARPGEASALPAAAITARTVYGVPTSASKPAGQPPAQTPVGPIKVPE